MDAARNWNGNRARTRRLTIYSDSLRGERAKPRPAEAAQPPRRVPIAGVAGHGLRCVWTRTEQGLRCEWRPVGE